MHILQIVPHYLPANNFGGPLQVAHELSKSFKKLKNEVTIITTDLKNRNEKLHFAGKKEAFIDGIKVYYETVSLLWYWGFSISMIYRIRNEIPKNDLVIIHAHFQFANFIAALLCRKYNCPYVIFPHSTLKKTALNNGRTLFKKAYIKFIESENIQKSIFLAFNAVEELEDSLFKEKGVVIPNGINPESIKNCIKDNYSFRKKWDIDPTKIIYTFLGRLDIKQKAIDKILLGFRIALNQCDDLQLILAGPSEGNDITTIKKLINDLQLKGNVTLTGLLDNRDKVEVLTNSDVFLLPSNSEGLSISLLEAMYVGLPVIVSNNVGLNNKIMEEDCGIVVSSNQNEIGSAILQMLDVDLRIKYGKNAKELIIKDHLWDNIANYFLSTTNIYLNSKVKL